MKIQHLSRMTAGLLAILLLAGCAKTHKVMVNSIDLKDDETTAPEETMPQQEEMPGEELEKAIANVDMSVLCAGFDTVIRTEKLENPYRWAQSQVVYADYDQDGYGNLLLGRQLDLMFQFYPQREVSYSFAQSGPVYYTDDAGNLYQYMGIDDGFDIEVNGQPGWVDHMNCEYRSWKDGRWEVVYSYQGSMTYVVGANDQLELVEDNVVANIDGQTGSKAQLDAQLETIGMREIYSQPSQYIRNQYDAVYQDSLLRGLDNYFADNYSGYSKVTTDIDGDGEDETLFVLPDFVDLWCNSLRTTSEYNDIENARQWFDSTFSGDYTGILIADTQADQLTVTAYCAMQYLSVYEGMNIRTDNGFLWLDDTCVYLSGRFAGMDSTNIPNELIAYMADYGYSGHFFRTVDVTDLEGEEYMCVCMKDGTWYIFIIVFIDGNPTIVYNNSLEETAIYLTEYQGKQCLLTYYQSMWQQGDDTISNYDYSIIRIGANGQQVTLDNAYCQYTDKDEDATSVSAFFEKLNVYLVKIIVIRDPYKLTGKLWMDQADVAHGTVPQEDTQPGDPQQTQPDGQTPVMGFVQIEDPASWLNLRVGPGVEYDKVLVDENDPNSFVRQALGSPVTVLETIETGDPENPVWLKIRIQYADREIIGYSSKTYIRLAGE